jgi:hypothetical protein
LGALGFIYDWQIFIIIVIMSALSQKPKNRATWIWSSRHDCNHVGALSQKAKG